jgi:signal transduction histidine kinase
LRKISTQSLADFSGAELMDSLQIAEKQSQSLATLIKDLLNVSLASTGRLTLNKETVNLATLTQSLVNRFKEEIKISGSNFKLVIKDEEVTGDWDVVRIEQAISNLLTNAFKYAKGKNITLTVKKDEKFAVLEITDNGEGIDQRYHKAIFEPFRRATNNTNAKGLE